MDKSSGSLAAEDESLLDEFTVKFWGVRGNVPIPGADTIQYGGNTACVEVWAGDQQLIFDGGTGLQALGRHLLCNPASVKAHIFFTNAQWDRIQGFPFFLPAFVPGNHFDIYGAAASTGASIKQCLAKQMVHPNFPIPLHRMSSDMVFHNLTAGTILELKNGVTVEAMLLSQSTSALGFRVRKGERSLVYATGVESPAKGIGPGLVKDDTEVDLLIRSGTSAPIDHSMVTDPAGSVPAEQTVELIKGSRAKAVVLSNHHQANNDQDLQHLEKEITHQFPHVRLAREGMVLNVPHLRASFPAVTLKPVP